MQNTTVTEREAREIMGRNFFGVDEAIDYFHLAPDEKNMDILLKIPFSRDLLRSCAKTHILVAVLPVSILGMRRLLTGGNILNYDFAAESGQAIFLKENDAASWQLILKWYVPESMGKDQNTQLELVGFVERIPTARDLMYALIVNLIINPHERFTAPTYMRCKGITNHPGETAVVGGDNSGLRAACDGGEPAIPYVGVARCELTDVEH